MSNDKKTDNKQNEKKSVSSSKDYYFGGIKVYSLEEIEAEVLSDSVYLDVFAGSDLRFKDQIMPFQNGLEAIKKLNSYRYFYRCEEFKERSFPQTAQIGFLAQEVIEVLPELVKKDATGLMSVNYAQMAPVLVESIKELSGVIEKQSELIEELQKRIDQLEATSQNKVL